MLLKIMCEEVPDEIILKRCFVCGYFTCSTDHKVDSKTLEFIKKAREKHDYTFDYSKSVYVKSNEKLIIMCAFHGEFLQTPRHHVNRGQKCIKCSKRCPETAKQNFIKRIQKLGGTVMGKYVKNSTKVKCMCKEGHICFASPDGIRSGLGFCLICANQDPETARQNFIKNIEKLEGKVIGEYINSSTKVKCVCKNGHICMCNPNSIQQGGGMCIICSGCCSETAKQNFIKRIQELGGTVIGEYKGAHVPVKCMCQNGHICNPSPGHIRDEEGMCRICSKHCPETARKNFIEKIEKLGGKVVGEYKSAHIPVKCMCQNGHICNPSPTSIQQDGGMCIICAKQDPETARKNFIEKIEKLGGKVVGEYIKALIPVKCICEKGHICNPIPGNIQQGRNMCKICSQTGYSKNQ